jgi:hypothetical protein
LLIQGRSQAGIGATRRLLPADIPEETNDSVTLLKLAERGATATAREPLRGRAALQSWTGGGARVTNAGLAFGTAMP